MPQDLSITIAIIGGLASICAIIFGYLSYSRNKKHDVQAQSETLQEIKSDLSWIKKGVDELKACTQAQSKVQQELSNKVSKLEARVDDIEKRIK